MAPMQAMYNCIYATLERNPLDGNKHIKQATIQMQKKPHKISGLI